MKKEVRKKQLFEAAWQIVESEGIEKLNARKLANRCSCSVGSIYTIFESFQELQLSLNAKILSMLYASLTDTLEKGIQKGNSLKDVFKEMGLAYITFGQNNRLLWKSLFESLPTDSTPDWYIKHTNEGIHQICERLSNYFGLSKQASRRILGFFWTSIHGVSAIFLNKKMKMVSELFDYENLDSYVDFCLEGLFKEAADDRLASK